MSVEEKLELLMQEVRQSRREVVEKLESTLAEVKREVNTAQEKMSQDVARKIGNTSYQFRKKGHEHQYKFNCDNQLRPYGIGESEVVCTGGKGIAEESGV